MFPIFGVIAAKLPPPDATRHFWGMGPLETGKRSSLVARRPGLWSRARTKRATVSAGGEPARLDESVEVAAIEEQSPDARQCDSRQRPALDEISDGPGADAQIVGGRLDVEEPGPVDRPTGSANQRDGCAFALFRVDVTRDVTRSWLRSDARAARAAS